MFDYLDKSKRELCHIKTLLSRLPALPKPSGALVQHKSKGGFSYSLRVRHGDESKIIPLGKEDSKAVIDYKTRRIQYEQRRRLQKNLVLLEAMVKRFLPYDELSIQEALPPALQRDLKASSKRGKKNVPKASGKTNHSHNSKRDDDLLHYESSYNFPSYNPAPFIAIHIAIDGTRVRSKSELAIYNRLYSYGISFAYEKLLVVADEKYGPSPRYPDFTIFLPDGRKLYWEHLGLIEASDYAERTVEKLRLYAGIGVFPSNGLIFSAESETIRFDSASIDWTIRNQILPFLE